MNVDHVVCGVWKCESVNEDEWREWKWQEWEEKTDDFA